jgi:F0F1-type ATP synthase assembly protein I
MPDDRQSPTGKGFGEGYEYLALALAVPFAMLLFGGAGWVLDGWLHTRPLFAIIGGLLGAFAGTARIYYRVKSETGADRGGRGRTG